VVEHSADEGGFHGVEEVKVLLVGPNRRGLGVRRFHWVVDQERREKEGWVW